MTAIPPVADDEAMRIAGTLTKAQCMAVLAAQERRKDRWHVPNAGRVRAKLFALQLAYPAVPDFAWRSDKRDTVLTSLGLRVRASLQNGGTGE